MQKELTLNFYIYEGVKKQVILTQNEYYCFSLQNLFKLVRDAF